MGSCLASAFLTSFGVGVNLTGVMTCGEEELKFEDSAGNVADIPIRTAPFEIMEEFEEAPEEFDLGISSYSIAHPIDYDEEMDRTPVPSEIFYESSDAYSTLGRGREEDSHVPYSVTTPSSTLDSRRGHTEHSKQQNGTRMPPPPSQAKPNYNQPSPYNDLRQP